MYLFPAGAQGRWTRHARALHAEKAHMSAGVDSRADGDSAVNAAAGGADRRPLHSPGQVGGHSGTCSGQYRRNSAE